LRSLQSDVNNTPLIREVVAQFSKLKALAMLIIALPGEDLMIPSSKTLAQAEGKPPPVGLGGWQGETSTVSQRSLPPNSLLTGLFVRPPNYHIVSNHYALISDHRVAHFHVWNSI
jgi:hypothetical protein